MATNIACAERRKGYAMCNVKKHVALIESLAIRREFREMIFSKNSIQLFKLRLK